MPRGETHLAHVSELEPVFGNFFELFIDQWVRSGGSFISVDYVQLADFTCCRKCLQIDDGLFGNSYGLILQRVIGRQPVFGSEIYTWRPAMPFAVAAVVFNSLLKQFIRC